MLRASTRLLRGSQFTRSMSSLVVADHDNKKLGESTLRSIAAASKLDSSIVVLVAGKDVTTVAAEAAKAKGVSTVIVADHDQYAHGIAENLTSLIVDVQKNKKFQSIVGSSTAFAKNVLPRVAALLDVAPVADVIGISSKNKFVRPIYAGNALSTVESSDPVQILTVRSTAFEPVPTGSNNAPIEKITSSAAPSTTQWVRDDLRQSDRPELTSARVIVSGGRGLKAPENFKLLNDLADTMKAAVGASRAAVDAGWVPNDMQIGQTGKNVAPELYIAVGISGAIQHLAGMKDSKTIVAINKDSEAPIFQVSDYGLVGDLFTVVPQMTSAIKSAK